MYWFKESFKLFFSATKKELLSLFCGTLVLLVGFLLNAPEFKIGYAISILILLTMMCRYNFVADFIIDSDLQNLKKNKKFFSYIISKNIFSFLLTFIIVFLVFIINLLITKTTLSQYYYLNLIYCGIDVISLNNIIFIFHNKPSKLRSNNYSTIKNITLGFNDLIESLPYLLIVFLVYFSNIYFYKISLYHAVTAWIFSVLLLNLKIESLIKNTT